MINCSWLPGLIEYTGDFTDDTELENYKKNLLDEFNADLAAPIKFNDKIVVLKKGPLEDGLPYAFYHLISQDYSHDDTERELDFNRCKRIKWIKQIIENYAYCSTCNKCKGIKVWREHYKTNRIRWHFLFSEENYLIVLEEKKDYYLIITAFYLDRFYSLDKEQKKYENAQKTRDALN